MSLDNLVRTGQLKTHTPTATEIQRLLTAAVRNLHAARVREIGEETRFDVACNAIMPCALAALMATGFRPSTSVPGDHPTLIAALTMSLPYPGKTGSCWILCAGGGTSTTIQAI